VTSLLPSEDWLCAEAAAPTLDDALASAHESFGRPERSRNPPAGRSFQFANPLHERCMFLVAWAAIGVGKHSDRLLDVQPRPKLLREALSRIEGDVVKPVQLIDDHQLNKLIDAHRLARCQVVLLVVPLFD
jgi:hypothetical protein